MQKIVPVILSGGSGTRLWPLSRELYPKQFLPLTSQHTMIQETILRICHMAEVGDPIIICNEDHRFLVAEQLRQINIEAATIILEPVARNTAPAVAVAAISCEADDQVLLILPADHVIANVAEFQRAIQIGLQQALEGKLVTFGIVPDHPETGYGYIKAKATKTAKTTIAGALPIASFAEKPDLETARAYVKSGEYFWNSGMFMFKPSVLLAEIKKYTPQINEACRPALKNGTVDADFTRLAKEHFAASPSISIDYAVMEKTAKGMMIPLDAGWNDVGSWAALADVNPSDEQGNQLKGDVLTHDVKNTSISATSRLVTAVGVNNLIIVETADAILVADKEKVQDVKAIVDQLKKAKRSEAVNHRRVNRPWGTYETIDVSDRFLAKRITVNPGARLSLQRHYHRAEHWIVVKGTAKITKGSEIIILSENQSTYISLGQTHRLENPGKILLELIEVQSGSYLQEDDIERLEDTYGRV